MLYTVYFLFWKVYCFTSRSFINHALYKMSYISCCRFNDYGNDGGPAAKTLEPRYKVFSSHVLSNTGFELPEVEVRITLLFSPFHLTMTRYWVRIAWSKGENNFHFLSLSFNYDPFLFCNGNLHAINQLGGILFTDEKLSCSRFSYEGCRWPSLYHGQLSRSLSPGLLTLSLT